MNEQLTEARIALLRSRIATAFKRDRGINLHRKEVALVEAILQWMQDGTKGQSVATHLKEQDDDR